MKKRKEQLIAESLPLVAIDFGSSKIRVMAAEQVSSERLHILGVEESDRYVCVERGVITQTSNAAFMMGECLRLLANRIGYSELPTAFVSVGGLSTQICEVSAKRDQVRAKTIARSLLDEMENECRLKIEEHYPQLTVLGLIPSFFVLDGQEQDYSPEATQRAVLVEGHYIAFVAQKRVGEQLQKVFDQAGKSIEKSFIRQDALLSAFASEDGFWVVQEGCALIDFGAQTTTLSVCKENQYLFHKVYKWGGDDITQRIANKGISLATAEQLKRQFGYASEQFVEKNQRLRIKAMPAVGGEISISTAELAQLISGELDEQIAPMMEQINNFANRIRTVYITGGASMLQGLDAYLQDKTSVQVIYGAHDKLIDDEQYDEPTYSALVGTLLMGADYREEHKGAKVPKPGTLKKLEDLALQFFTDAESKVNMDNDK